MLKNLSKFVAVVLVIVMVFSFAMVVNAATVYSVKVTGNKVQFLIGSKVVGKYTTADKNIDVNTSGGELRVSFTDLDGIARNVNLADQTSLKITGTMDKLTLKGDLSSYVSVSLPSGTAISLLEIDSSSNVSIGGKIGVVAIGGAPTVSILKTARIVELNKGSGGASVSIANGAVVLDTSNSHSPYIAPSTAAPQTPVVVRDLQNRFTLMK